jgi:cyclophilin family peptidyl-prolyl cis-trans isomerase
MLAGCGPDQQASAPPASETANAPASASANAPANAPASTEAAKPTPGAVQITIDTSRGAIDAELYPDKAPLSVKNFVGYVKKKHYDGTIFHRVIPTFMIQGGGFTPDMKEKPTDPPIKNEGGNGLKNDRGTLAMARTSEPDSATSQFFINVKDNGFLNRAESPDGVGYAVFGKVLKGMDVVDQIKDVPTAEKNGMGDVPVEPVLIKSIKIK